MSASSLKNFNDMIDSGFTVVASRYEDSTGNWAKDVEFVERVRVKLNDATTLFLTMAEVKALTRERRLAIDLAPSDEISLGVA